MRGGVKFLQNFTPLMTKFANSIFDNFSEKEWQEIDLLGATIAAPVFVLSDTIKNYMKCYDDALRGVQKFAKYIICPDEVGITIALHKNQISYEKLDWKTYNTEPKLSPQNIHEAKILHCAGQPKFWNGLYNETWQSYYNEWINKYDGTAFNGLIVKKEQESIQRRIKIFWRKIKIGKVLRFTIKIVLCFFPYGFIVIARKMQKRFKL